jgi:hypothetical protein
VDADDREVGKRIRADHVEPRLGAVGELGRAAVAAGHHVGVGEEESVVGEGDCRAGTAAAGRADGEGRDGGEEAGGDAGHHAAVGIERLG